MSIRVPVPARLMAMSILIATCLAGVGVASADPLLPSAASELLLRSPGVSPSGANDFGCRPDAQHPHPVVLVHGGVSDMTMNWSGLSPKLAEAGYCVFALDLERRGTAPIADLAEQLAAFVGRVREATGARQVSLVGHSMGGMVSGHYLRFGNGHRDVRDWIGFASPNHGTASPIAPTLARVIDCPSCAEIVTGSPFMLRFNRGAETHPEVDYTSIATRHDLFVIPYESVFLRGPSDRVTNVIVQDRCPADTADHLSLVGSRAAVAWMFEALRNDGPADPAFVPPCSPA